MRKPHFAFQALFVIILLGTFPGITKADDPPTPTPATPTSLELWQSPTGRLGQAMRLDANFKFGVDRYKNLENLQGRQQSYARGVFGVEGTVDFLLNKEGVDGNAHDNEFRVGAEGHFVYASDNDGGDSHGYQNIDLLDAYRTGGLVYAYLGSSQVNKDWSYSAKLGTGADYVNWGATYSIMWRSQIVLEGGWRAGDAGGFAIGPVAGVVADLRVGEHQSNWLDLELSAGIRAVSEDFTVDVRLLTQMRMSDSNRLTGGPGAQKVQEESIDMGVKVGLLAWGRLSLDFSWTSALLQRFEVYKGSRFSDQTPGDSFALAAGFRF